MANVPMTQKDSIVDQLEQLHQRIARRAYDLFRGRDVYKRFLLDGSSSC